MRAMASGRSAKALGEAELAALAARLSQPGCFVWPQRGRFAVYGEPAEQVALRHTAGRPDRVKAALRALLGRRGEGVVAGFLAYELGGAFEAIAPAGAGAWPRRWPDLVLWRYRAAPMTASAEELDAAARLLADGGASPLQARIAKPDGLGRIGRCVAYVRAGDVFQVNWSAPFEAMMDAHPARLFAALTMASPAPFAAYAMLDPDCAVASNSPELLVRASPEGDAYRLMTRPIKGTRPRRADPADDAASARELLASEKDRAENLMIVDLMRNDLSRVCRPGTVKAPALFRLESYANVHHLVSEVTGETEPGADLGDLVAALFPGGSVTGAPKVRAMEIIAELEDRPRGPFCGSLLHVGPDGAAEMSILIRTAACVREDGGWRVEARAGAGLVADSEPEAEWAEMNDKAAAIKAALARMQARPGEEPGA